MLSGSRKPTMIILVSKYYCIMGNMQLIYLICNFKSFFHSSVENYPIKKINVSTSMFAWPINPKKVF